jgi:pimeloyl-ACP methyl ester carboxylesterase
VHLSGQDIAGPTTFRLAAGHPDLVRSFTGIETGLPGFGLEMLGDVYHGGAWHIGVLAAPGIAEMLLTGRERAFLADYAYPTMCGTPDAISERDVEEFARTYARANGFRGAHGLYGSTLTEADDMHRLATQARLQMPVLAVGAGSGDFTRSALDQVAESVSSATVAGVGHFAAMEAPEALAQALLGFYRTVDA